MAMTQVKGGTVAINRGSIHVYTETGTANTNLLSTTGPIGTPFRLLLVTIAYSAAATQTGVTTTINANAGAGYDTVLNTGTANARYTTYQPVMDLVFAPGDAIDVSALAGGAAVTASVQIYVEKL